MPRYYCDYCDTYLTHDSPSVRKQHNAGYKHKANVRSYYQQFEEQQTQSLIDQRIKEHLGQTAAFQQVGAVYNQHLASLPRPGMPILPTPAMPALHSPLAPGIRPPILPRPVAGIPGYCTVPMMQPLVAPPGAPIPMQVNGLPRPPALNPQTATPGGTGIPSSNGTPTMSAPAMYQPTSAAPTSGGFDTFNINASSGLQMPAPSGTAVPPTSTGSQDGFSYAEAPETNP